MTSRNRRVDWDEVVRLRQAGMTLTEIGRQVGCTRENVSQILKKHIPDPNNPTTVQRTVRLDPGLTVTVRVQLPERRTDSRGEPVPISVEVDLGDGDRRVTEKVTHLRDRRAPGEQPGSAGVS